LLREVAGAPAAPREVPTALLPAAGQAASGPQTALNVWSAAGKLIELQNQAPPITRTPGNGPWPLSFAQERLWWLERSEPGAAYYHVPLAWDIRGELDVAALERGLNHLAQRHPALRTAFPETDAGPVQQVNDWHLRLDVVPIAPLPGKNGRAEAIRQAGELLHKPFALTTGPLLRAVLYRWSAREALLVWVVHQMNFDGGSMRIIGRELGECYRAFAAGGVPSLPALPIEYAHYACWQRDSLNGERLEQAVAFWRSQTRKGYRPLPLGTGGSCCPNDGCPAAQVPVLLSKDLRDELRRLSVAEGATTFAAVFASFEALLSCYTGCDDILTLASVAARTEPKLRHLVGLVSNVLPLRLDLSGGPSLRQLIRRASAVVSAAFAHQVLPLSQILDMLVPADSTITTPLLQVAVAYMTTPPPVLDLGPVTFTPCSAVENRTSKLHLQLELADGRDGVTGHLKYRSDLLPGDTARSLVEDWQDLIAKAVANPDLRLQALTGGPRIFQSAAVPGPRLAPGSRAGQRSGIAADWKVRAPAALASPDSSTGPDEAPGPVTSRAALEEALTRIWERVFGLHPIRANDNFFGLGGHSLLGTRIVAAIEQEMGRTLRLSTLFQEPTIARLAAAMQGEQAARWSSIVEIQPQGNRPPLFLVHGVGGGMFWGYNNLARCLGNTQPVYGFKSRGLDGLEEFTRIEDMAAHYVEELRRFQPEGPYNLGGYCFGGNVAFEMACQLAAQGEKVGLLVLMNCWPNNSSYTRLSCTPQFFAKALWNFGLRLAHQVRFGAQRPRDYLRWRTAWVYKRLKAVITRNLEDRVAVEDIVDLSQQTPAERQLWRTHVRAWLQYQPKRYPGRIVLFRTRGHPLVCSFDHQMGWAGLAAGGVEVHICPGDHESILEEENAFHTARYLQTALAEARTAQTSYANRRTDTPVHIEEPLLCGQSHR